MLGIKSLPLGKSSMFAVGSQGLFCIKTFLRSVTAKLREGKQIFHLSLVPYMCILPHVSIPHQSGIFVTTDKPTIIYHIHLKSRVYIIAHSWYCTFYRFEQMQNFLDSFLGYIVLVRLFSIESYCKNCILTCFLSLTTPHRYIFLKQIYIS